MIPKTSLFGGGGGGVKYGYLTSMSVTMEGRAGCLGIVFICEHTM